MINKNATSSSKNIMQILNNITWFSCLCTLKVTHMGATICWPQEAEIFSILSIWAGERQAAGRAPRGIHLSLTSTLWAVATGDRGNVRDFSFSFVTLSNNESICIVSVFTRISDFSFKWLGLTSSMNLPVYYYLHMQNIFCSLPGGIVSTLTPAQLATSLSLPFKKTPSS